MAIHEKTLLFFDSSCLIAAGSASGGSHLVLAICTRGFLRGAVSQPVLAEAEGNILSNLQLPALVRYRQEVLPLPLIIAPVPSRTGREAVAPITGEKDAYVLASAVSVGAQYLITLDKPLANQIAQAEERSVNALSPGKFIRTQLPTHPAFPAIKKE